MNIGKMKKPHSSFSLHRLSFAQGFTLIEVLLVVVIILIATGISVPIFRGTLQSTQMTDAVRTTIRMARFARSMSIIKQDECILRIKEDRLTLSCGDTNSAEPEISRRLPNDIKIGSFENLAEADKNPDEGHVVHFYPTGMNDGFKLTLSGQKDRRSTVTCNPISGKTSVEEGR